MLLSVSVDVSVSRSERVRLSVCRSRGSSYRVCMCARGVVCCDVYVVMDAVCTHFLDRCSWPRPTRLLAENDLATGANVLARLRGTLVRAGLQPNDGLARVQLLLGEVALALVGRFRAQERSLELGMFVALRGGE